MTLRPVCEDDLGRILDWHNRPELRKQTLGHVLPVTRAAIEKWVTDMTFDRASTKVVFSIETNSDGQLVGLAQLDRIEWVHRTCFFGILIGDEAARGQGFGREALELLFAYSSAALNLRKISCEVLEGNGGAIDLYRRLGFSQEGRLIRQVYYDNEYLDVLILSREETAV